MTSSNIRSPGARLIPASLLYTFSPFALSTAHPAPNSPSLLTPSATTTTATTAMATRIPQQRARPRPSVIQSPDGAVDLHARGSLSSGSSSNHASGESWFRPSHSLTSHSSHGSVPPLPKGARPPSPQVGATQRQVHQIPHNHTGRHDARAVNTVRDSTQRNSSSWKVEWRGISKMIRWAVLGEKLSPASSPGKSSKSPRSPGPQAGAHRRSRSRARHHRSPRPVRPDSRPGNSERPHASGSASGRASGTRADELHPSSSRDRSRHPSPPQQSDLGHGAADHSNISAPLELFHASRSAQTSRQRHGSLSVSAVPASVQYTFPSSFLSSPSNAIATSAAAIKCGF